MYVPDRIGTTAAVAAVTAGSATAASPNNAAAAATRMILIFTRHPHFPGYQRIEVTPNRHSSTGKPGVHLSSTVTTVGAPVTNEAAFGRSVPHRPSSSSPSENHGT